MERGTYFGGFGLKEELGLGGGSLWTLSQTHSLIYTLEIVKKTLDHFMRSLFFTNSKMKEVNQRLSGKTPTPLVKGELALFPINKVQCY